MSKHPQSKSRLALITSMCIFGSVGIVRRYIPLPSGTIALARALIGALFLLGILILGRKKPDWAAMRENRWRLALSGIFLGFNWVFLFEAYRCTSVATATLCYYTAPILVILASPLVLKEKLSPRKMLCVPAALLGMVLVSGIFSDGSQEASKLQGVLQGLAAAALYAGVVLLNKKLSIPSAYDRTIVQLSTAALVLIPYALLTERVEAGAFDIAVVFWLLVAGILHTGIAYALYFGSIRQLPAQTAALYSYIDPVLAIVLSALLLGEPMDAAGLSGTVLILGAAYFGER